MAALKVRGGARMWKAGALALILASALGGCADTDTVSPEPTVRVERTSVSSRVTASGALVAVSSQNLAFPQSEKLTEVAVRVGDRVSPGQVLARLDAFSFRQTLAEREGVLQQQIAFLDKIINGTAVEGAEDSLAQAKRVLDATKAVADSNNDRAAKAVYRAEKQLEFDEKAAEKTQRQYEKCETKSKLTELGAEDPAGGSGSPLLGESGGVGGAPDPTGHCAQLKQAAIAAKRQVVASKTALADARKNQDVVEDEGRLRVENARSDVVDARNTYRSADTDRPSDIEAQAGIVAQARAQVNAARRDVENTVLIAPVAGTVAAINGSVGEYVASGGGTTALAPGSTASIPGVGAGATADQTNSNVGAPTATRPGGNAFIVLNDVNTFQVVVPFEESDASRVAPNQRVEVRFDAIPDLVRKGTVLAIAPGGTSISGVTNYYATILLAETDPRLTAGQTAEVAVLVEQTPAVLVVPNSAVIADNGRTFVLTPGPEGQPVQAPFQAGAVGDEGTEVVSGLREGQQILLPPTAAQPAPGK